MARPGFKGVGGDRHCEHTQQHASVLNACQRRCLTNSPSEGQSDKWLEDKILCAVRQHRCEDKNGESAGMVLGPHFLDSLRKRGFLFWLNIADHCGLSWLFNPNDGSEGDCECYCRCATDHSQEPCFREWI